MAAPACNVFYIEFKPPGGKQTLFYIRPRRKSQMAMASVCLAARVSGLPSRWLLDEPARGNGLNNNWIDTLYFASPKQVKFDSPDS
jgi:hypothetical protein